jgi:hypothetical protein
MHSPEGCSHPNDFVFVQEENTREELTIYEFHLVGKEERVYLIYQENSRFRDPSSEKVSIGAIVEITIVNIELITILGIAVSTSLGITTATFIMW